MTNEHCGEHEENIKTISRIETTVKSHEERISDLYDKHEEVMDMLTQMKVCMENMNGNMQKNFIKQELTYGQLNQSFLDHTNLSNSLLEKYDKIIENFNSQLSVINGKLSELDKFKWFRDRLNKAKECLPDVVLWIFIAFLAFLASEHWLDLSGKIGRWLNRG